MIDFKRRVDAGILLLDKVRPGWEGEIDVETLDIDDLYYCVLGQLYGSYRPQDVLPDEDDRPSRYGFDLADEDLGKDEDYWDDDVRQGICEDLTAEWRRRILERVA